MLFNKIKPFFVSAELTQAELKKDLPLALDMHLCDIAKKEGKEIYGIEKLEDQMKAIDKISLQEQARMLMDGVKDSSDIEEKFKDLLETYLNADLDKMVELTNDSTLPADFSQAFLVSRNKTMAKSISKLIKKHKTFVAIGAAHLGGKDGIITLLRKKGYTVEPIPFEFIK